MRGPEEVKRGFVRQWLHKARGDLRTAEHLAQERPDLGFAAAFHAQQAVEKMIKAVLVWHQVEFPKSHDLDRLVELLRGPDAKLADALREASSLTLYAVDARYPGDLPDPTREETRGAVELAERACRVAMERLPVEFRPAWEA